MALSRKVYRISNQKIHLVTGKGGVGKSTVAAAMAIKLSKLGRKTLLVELGERGFYSHAWNQDFHFEGTSVGPNLFIARWNGEQSLREYFGHLVKVKQLVSVIFDNRVMKSLVRAAPALNELSILGKLTSGIRKIGPAFDYDDVVVDAYATGHFRALLNAPKGMAEAISKGPMGEQCRSIEAVLKNRDQVKISIVCLPEELPVNESLELQQYLKTHFNQEPTFILNKCFDVEISKESLDDFTTRHTEFALANHLSKALQEQNNFYSTLCEQNKKSIQLFHQWIPTSFELYESLSERIPGEFCD